MNKNDLLSILDTYDRRKGLGRKGLSGLCGGGLRLFGRPIDFRFKDSRSPEMVAYVNYINTNVYERGDLDFQKLRLINQYLKVVLDDMERVGRKYQGEKKYLSYELLEQMKDCIEQEKLRIDPLASKLKREKVERARLREQIAMEESRGLPSYHTPPISPRDPNQAGLSPRDSVATVGVESGWGSEGAAFGISYF